MPTTAGFVGVRSMTEVSHKLDGKGRFARVRSFSLREHAQMSVMKIMRWFAVFFLAALYAEISFADYDPDAEEKPWEEMAATLPAFPEKGNLIPFTVGAVSDTRFYVDGASITIGADGVVRYTLVVVSSEGAETVSHEGLHCATRERRFYAFGRSDRTWSKPRSSQWVRIQGTSNNPHVELYSTNFCAYNIVSVASPEEARRVLRNGGIPRP
jgi:hypothetical protein